MRVTVVHPGGVATNIARSAAAPASFTADELDLFRARQLVYERKLLKMPPDKAAEIIIHGVERGRKRILVGSDARTLDRVVRLLPTAYLNLLVRAERILAR